MTYVDPSADLPPYLRQQPAGPSGGPSGAPQGGGAMAWLQYLAQRFGISPQQAMTMMQSQGGGQSAADMPAPDAQNVSMVKLTSDDFRPPPGPNGAYPDSSSFSSFPSRPPAPAPAPPARPTFPARPAGVSASGLPLQPGSLSPDALSYFGGGAAAPTPYGGGSAGPGVAATATPDAIGGAGDQGATANPRFVPIDMPNQDPLARRAAGAGPPQMSALNLAGLFNRGQPAANVAPAAAPRGAVTVTRPTVPGPLASNPPMPPVKPGDIAAQQVAAALKNRNWWQGLG